MIGRDCEERDSLDTLGYVVLNDVLDFETLTKVREQVERLYAAEGENAGSEFRKEPGSRRLANLVDKGEIFEQLVAVPRILELVRHVLGDRFKLSSFNARSANPRSSEAQPLHCDAGALPDHLGFWSAIQSGFSTTSPGRMAQLGLSPARRPGQSCRRILWPTRLLRIPRRFC